MTRIELQALELTHERPVEVLQHYLELGETYIKVRRELYRDKKNDDLGVWESDYDNQMVKIKKDQIAGISLCLTDELSYYKIYLYFSNDDIHLGFYFKTEKEARPVFDQIEDWLFH